MNKIKKITSLLTIAMFVLTIMPSNSAAMGIVPTHPSTKAIVNATVIAALATAPTGTQANLDKAERLVIALPHGTVKVALQAKLDASQIILTPALKVPTAAVALAETNLTQANVNSAQILENELSTGIAYLGNPVQVTKVQKTALQLRINDAQVAIELSAAKAAEALLRAREYVNYNFVTQAVQLPELSLIQMILKTTAIKLSIVTLVKIPDKIPPIIQLIGSSTAPVSLGATAYSDPGAVAKDNLAGDVTYRIITTGTILTNKVGTYILTYSVSDVAGNKATITRTVNVVPRLVATSIPQFVTQLLIPSAMPKSVDPNPTPNTDYYEIAMRQFNQQILPTTFGKTTVWGYGSTSKGSIFNAPSLSIEATANKPVRIKWINDLKDANGNYLPPLLPVDQTLDWANPAMAPMGSGRSPLSYVGPVPMVTHVHGAHVVQESDGNPEAWFLPAANNIPAAYMKTGMYYDTFKLTAKSGARWTPGNAVFDYTNDQRDATIWYHDHAMGMTRNNVYSGPAGFFLIRGNPVDKLTTSTTCVPAVLPGKALLIQPTALEVSSGSVYEIPIALQDRSFNSDGSLYYPDSRANFDNYPGPYSPTSDIAPIWNPETFGDTIIANGNTWPTQNVQPKRYRLRFLNGAQARTFILKFSNNLNFTQIGAEQGFLKAPEVLPQLLIAPAERADVIVDFTDIAPGTSIILNNLGPDLPYNGGVQTPANPLTTGKVMQFVVVASNGKRDMSTPPDQLVLPKIALAAPVNVTKKVSINEMTSMNSNSMGIGPQSAMLGTVVMSATGVPTGVPQPFMAPITENVKLNDTEVWEIYNFTVDAHPIHLHLVNFEVLNRQVFDPITGVLGPISPPNSWENGPKDTVLALPGQITRIKAKFDIAGLYMWHCHILEHEDNEMMRPYLVK